MARLLYIFLTLISSYAYAKPITVAVIDTGFGYTKQSVLKEKHLCKYGHRDFTGVSDFIDKEDIKTVDKVPLDQLGHGTNVVGLIDKNAGKADYCIVVVKFYANEGKQNIENSAESIKYAASIKADIINYSAGGTGYNPVESEEVKKYLNSGGIFVAAAGNDGSELNDDYNYYPASYDPRIIVVGNLNEDNTRHLLSNYGSIVTDWENGTRAEVFGIKLTGSSQAAAIATGKLINKLKDKNGIQSSKTKETRQRFEP